MNDPGPRVGSGRDTEIFDLGDGRLLRRARDGRSLEREASVMSTVRAAGFPVPNVFEVRGDGTIVMERIEGPTMLTRLTRAPWELRRHARTLADLHSRLHEIAAPQGIPEVDGGGPLIHLDLHPDNVIISPDGPVLIDWANASAGPADLDVAVTWLLLATGDVPRNRAVAALANALRDRFIEAFLSGVDRVGAETFLSRAGQHRVGDRNTRPHERDAVAAFLNRHGV